jgi:hypothetical protein
MIKELAMLENVMTMERWNALTPFEQGLLKRLSVSPETPKKHYEKKPTNPVTLERRLSTRNTAPAEYYTEIHKTCGCCHKKVVVEGKMCKRKPSDTFLSLEVMEIPAGEIFKQINGVSVTCGHCDVELEKLEKAELIKMIRNLREVSARKCAL